MSYSAGTAWLQVVPSFRHIDRELGREVSRLAGDIDRGLRASIPEAMRRGVDDGARRMDHEADRTGRRAGDRYGSAFTDQLHRRLRSSMRALPDVEIDADSSEAQREIAAIRAELASIRDQHIKLEIDDDEALRRIALVRQRMLGMERRSTDRADVVNLRAAGADLDVLDEMARQATRSGREAGGNFGGAFGRTVREHLARVAETLPEIPIDGDPTPLDNVLRRIRRNVLELRDFRIGIDGDADEFFRRVAAVQVAIEKLRRQNVSIPVNFDLDRAMAGLRHMMNDVAPNLGRDGGRRMSGRFTDEVNNRITAALRQLPDIEIDADSTPAQHEIARIRTEMASIRDLHNEGHLDATEVLARLQVLQARLRAMALQDVDIQVRADTAGAMVQLAAVAALANNLDNEVRQIGNAASGTIGRLGAIIAAALSLGTILVPAAAGAAVAIGGIATAATAAAAGLGVLILGLSGVVGGITALHKYQQDVNKSSKALAQSHTQVANAIDAIGSAERSLASTRENVSAANARAARAVVDAQESVTEAVKNRRRAELDLIEAIKEAKRADEDRALSLEENALAQRQSTLDIADAKKELDAVLANPSATDAEREQAQITYLERLNQMKRLKLESERLSDEQAEATKSGLMGSKQVVAAQERVLDANKAVRDAEERVREARQAQAEQARQGAESIVSAQQAVIAAQRQAEQAYINAGVAGGEALDNLHDAMVQLSPEAQRFVKYVYGMRDAALSLRGAAERGMLPGFLEALRELQPYLPAVERFILKIGEALGWIAVQAVRSLQHPVWRDFFSFIDDTAAPALKGLFQFSEAVSRGLAALIMALSAFNPSMGRGLLSWAEGFATWAEKLESSTGFQRFLAYVRDNGPAVLDLLGDMVKFTARFVIAAAPIGAVVVRVFDALFAVLNKIPLPVLSTLITMIGLWSLALLANAAASRIMTQSHSLGANMMVLWQRVMAATTPTTAAYNAATLTAASSTNLLTRAQAGATIAAARTRVALSGIWTALSGPWGIAIAAATIGLSYLFSATNDQTQANESLRDSLLGLADAYAKAGSASSENIDSMVRQNKELRDLILNSRKVAVDVGDIAAAVNGEADARDRVLGSYDGQINRLQALAFEYDNAAALGAEEAELLSILEAAGAKNRDELGKMIDTRKSDRASIAAAINERIKEKQAADLLALSQRGLTATIGAFRDAMQAANPTADQFGKAIDLIGGIAGDTASKAEALALITDRVATSNLSASDKAKLFESALKGIGDAAQASGPEFDGLAGVFNAIASSALNARDKSDLLTKAIDQMYGVAIKQTEATETLARTQLELSARLADNGYGFDLTAKSAANHTQEVLSNRDALEAALQALRDKYVQDIANGVSEDKAREAHQKSTEALLGQIPVTQRNSKAVQDLVRDYGTIPVAKKTDVSTPGLDQAIFDLIKAHAINSGLSAKPPWTRDRINTEIAILKAAIFGGYAGDPKAFKAAGGEIEGYSPHRTADNIGIWATAGEYMQPVDTVDYYGVGAMDAIRRRAVPKWMLQGFASGGLIGYAGGGPISSYQTKGIDKGRWPVDIPNVIEVNVADWWKKYDAEVAAYYASLGGSSLGDVGPGPGFPPWPSSPGAVRYDSGVWRSIVNLIRSTGPISGAFGNAYRPGDPLWHGSGRAVDWMGYNQDQLANFLAAHRPLELIHRSNTRDYAYTRGVNKGSFNNQLMQEHRNHVHIAMDQGGLLQPGWNPPIWNGTGRVEPVLNPGQWDTITRMVAQNAQPSGLPRQYNFQFANTTLTPGKLRALQDRDDALSRRGRAR